GGVSAVRAQRAELPRPRDQQRDRVHHPLDRVAGSRVLRAPSRAAVRRTATGRRVLALRSARAALSITLVRFSQRPELWDDTEALSRAVWPEYNLHGAVLNSYWNRKFDDFPDFQFAL